ncbi:uncharacterized protein E0L32_000801 [Thyridium curvatum]|uniref:Dihydrodipicolinate synthase n=1 Tax=Thyridium curvatum TaxID=1093900 RepID=A0A507B1N9_9PEZI|nr:uncharacterized protein E0L32_000801 [Thyridium curvatum]TPX12624.1 hypothetical protein E0L32_000801 [Thyridium curvatum]
MVRAPVPPSGVWTPAVTFINPDTDELDLAAQEKYYAYLSKTGLAGLIVLGTNAEAFLLTREERRALVQTARKAVGPDYHVMAGVGAHSTKQVLQYIADAAEAGANSVLVLPPAYFGKATTPEVVERFFADVSAASSLPIVIYNFPGVCNGLDLDSDTIERLAGKYDNIVGVKLTCGSVAKITRLAAALPRDRFATFGGQSDFIIGGLASGSSGCICAFGNVAPKTVVRIYDLWQQGSVKEAMELHQKAALAEQAIKGGIAPTKYAASLTTAKAAGVEGAENLLQPRRPYVAPSAAVKEMVQNKLKDVIPIEEGLPLKA